MADATAPASNLQNASVLRGRFPKSLREQVEDPDFDQGCHCQCHIAPPVLTRRPQDRIENLKKVPKFGPIHDAAHGIPHECQLSEAERKRNHRFKRKLLLTKEIPDPSWKTGKIPRGFEEFESPNNVPAKDFGKLSMCYEDVTMGTMRWKAAQTLGPECLLSDYRLFFNVGGLKKMKMRFLVQTEPGMWHIRVEEGAKGMDDDAGANLAAQMDEVLDKNPFARIGLMTKCVSSFSSAGFGRNFEDTPRVVPRGMSITWPSFATKNENTKKIVIQRNNLKVLSGGEGLPEFDTYRAPWEKTKAKYHWLFERLDKRVRFRKLARANALAKPKVIYGSPSKYSVLRGLPGDQPKPWDGYGSIPKRERKTPPTGGVKNLKALNWMRLCLERKMRFRSMKSKSLTFVKSQGKMRPFMNGRCLSKRFPNNFSAALGVVSSVFGKVFGSITPQRFLQGAAYLNSWYTCPTSGFILAYKDGLFNFGINGSSGLQILFENKEIFHLRPAFTDRMKMALWKAAALLNLREAQEKGVKVGLTAISGANSAIKCCNPWYGHQLIGFTVAAICDGHKIFARGNDFSRPKEDDPELRITVRQYKRFWRKDIDLIFTMKGLAKVFFRKGENELKWRFAIAKSIGLTMDAALIHFSKLINDDSVPDVIERDLKQKFLDLKVKTIEKPVFIEIPVNNELYNEADAIANKHLSKQEPPSDPDEHITEKMPIPPPPPPFPSRDESAIRKTSQKHGWANGDDWLLELGQEGVSRRVIFRHTFPDDWWLRVSEKALKAMNQDLAKQNESGKMFIEELRIVDPTKDFDIFKINRPKVDLGLSTGPSLKDLLNEKIREFKPSSLRKTQPSTMDDTKKRRKRVTRTINPEEDSDSELEKFRRQLDQQDESKGKVKQEPELNLRGGYLSESCYDSDYDSDVYSDDEFSLYEYSHSIARNSEDSDIETNPGPAENKNDRIPISDDVFVVHHPSPSDVKKNRRKTNVNNSISFVNNRQSLAFTDTGSPIEKVMVTSPTPITPISFQDQFTLARGPSDSDIELNPGPVERGRSNSLEPSIRRNRSLSREVGQSIKNMFNPEGIQETKDQLLWGHFGFKGKEDFPKRQPSTPNWLDNEYDNHYVIGHLPKNKKWVLYEPCYSEREFLMNTCQRSLDSVFFAKEPFDRTKVQKVLQIMQKFFDKTLLNEGIDFRSISALAHIVKSEYSCPIDGSAYAFEIVPKTNEIVFHFSQVPKENLKNKIIWSIGASTCFHGAEGDGPSNEVQSPSASLSRRSSFSNQVRKVFGLETKDDLDFTTESFGFKGDFKVSLSLPVTTHWMYEKYETHHVVGHLPNNKVWKLYKPSWNERKYLMNTCQRSLDSLFYSKTHFTHSKVSETVDIMNKFFQKTVLNEGFDFRSLSALAHVVKTHFDCPRDNNGYAFELEPETNRIIFHYTSKPADDIKNKLIWSIGESTCFHGGLPSDEDFELLDRYHYFENASLATSISSVDYKFERFNQSDLDSMDVENRWTFTSAGLPAIDVVNVIQNQINKVTRVVQKHNRVLDKRVVSTIAYFVKLKIGCPVQSSFCFALNFSGTDDKCKFLVCRAPDPRNAGKLFFFIEGREFIHCGQNCNDEIISDEELKEHDLNSYPHVPKWNMNGEANRWVAQKQCPHPVCKNSDCEPSASASTGTSENDETDEEFVPHFKGWLPNCSTCLEPVTLNDILCDFDGRSQSGYRLGDKVYLIPEERGAEDGFISLAEWVEMVENTTKPGEFIRECNWRCKQKCRALINKSRDISFEEETSKQENFCKNFELHNFDHFPHVDMEDANIHLQCEHPYCVLFNKISRGSILPLRFRSKSQSSQHCELSRKDGSPPKLKITSPNRANPDPAKQTQRKRPEGKTQSRPKQSMKDLCWAEAEAIVKRMERKAALKEVATYHARHTSRVPGQSIRVTIDEKNLPKYDMKANLPFIYLYLRIWYFFISCKNVLVDHLWPDVADYYDPDHQDDDKPNEDKLLIAEYGTHGDIIPIRYYSNLARHYNIPVDERVYNKMDNDDLEHLRVGDFIRFMPKQLHMATYKELEYKAAFIPHIEVGGGDHSYCLNPSKKFVNDTKFVDDWSKVSTLNFLPALFATLTTKVVHHTWRIGAITDSNLPRSCDGKTLLKLKTNHKTGKIGWVSGSANENVIPKEIREKYERIPNGDHSEIFRNYDVIHCHGGAGTVQVIVASGAIPVIHDPTLDRDYHTLPTQEDFHQPSVAPFMGWLVWRGFNPTAPFFIKWIWVVSYLWSVKQTMIYDLILACVKLFVIEEYFRHHWGLFLIVFFSVPLIFWRAIYKTENISTVIRMVIGGMWNFPLFCLLDSKFSFVVTCWCIKTAFARMLQDWSNVIDRHTEILFEPVNRQGLEFPFPFGHYCVRDTKTGLIYEGHFTEPSQTLGSMFKFREIEREPKPGYKSFPAPFSIYQAKKMVLMDNIPKPYGPQHHCATYVARLVGKRSFTWTIFIAGVCALIGMALSPPEILRKIMNYFYPGSKISENPFYLKLGFAAGIEQIPFEQEEEFEVVHDKFEEAKPIVKIPEIDYSKEESLEGFLNEIAIIQNAVLCSSENTLEEDELQEVAEKTFLSKIDEIEFPKDSMITVEKIPPYVKHTWAEIVDRIHYSINTISESRLVRAFITWLKNISENILEFLFPILDMLGHLGNVLLQNSRSSFISLFESVCHFLDHVWGLEASKRVKSAWGLTGLHRTGMLGAKALLAANIQYAEYSGRTDFESDYKRFCDQAKHLAKVYGAKGRSKIGGTQRRRVGYSRPLMSVLESERLGFTEDEVTRDKQYQERIDSYLEYGAAQGADGVFLAEKRPELIAKSQHRYEPKYPELSSDDRQFAKDIALAFWKKFPETFANADLVTPQAVHNYIKKKYSPGTPFINEKGFKSRQAMFDAGFDKVLHKRAIKMLETGQYGPQFYHAFVKSQVVDILKCLSFKEGGKNKDVRTVVSQDLFSYFIDQCVQIERNKRITWDTYGAGIGMPLNQTMASVFEKVYDAQKERGGRYIIADATAFDSYCKPFLFEVNACLWELGFKDHPSGNGKNIASVVRASTDARQNAWIIGITEPEYDSLTVCIPDREVRKQVEQRNYKNLVPLAELINFRKFNQLSEEDKISYVKNIKVPDGKTIITWDQKFVPNRSNWMGKYVLGDTSDVANKFFSTQTFTYEPGDVSNLFEDVKAVSNSNYKLLSNVHPKNRGGSTGGSDTSNVNTVTFKAGIVAAWCLTTGRKPDEFFEYNTLYDTSDDTIWQTGGQHGLNTVNDIEKFKHYCSEFGIHLEMETTRDISKVEYLSKFVRPPTKEDSETLSRWRKEKIGYINQSRIARGLTPAKDFEELNNPRFLVRTNPAAILLRRTAFRYYQGSATKWRYTSIERGAGHAYNVAFIPDLYEKFALEWCDDVNLLLAHHKIHRKYQIKNGKFSLQEVVQVDPRASQQALSPRQKAFLLWLKGNMFPSYYKVIDVHMNVAKIDPEHHAKFLRKLEKGWRGWDQIAREGVDWLYSLTDQIPDEWSKKYQPTVEMLYAETPFYTYNMWTEKFVALSILQEKTEDEFTFGDMSQAIQESPYANACDLNHFWDKWQQVEFREELLKEDLYKIQGMVFCITALYMMTTTMEYIIMASPFGVFYKLFLWSFIGLNKVYGILNTMYWHSTAKSSREISRIMPRDPYAVSKQFCAFIADLLPSEVGYCFTPIIVALSFLPPCLESIGKTWYVATKIKEVEKKSGSAENPWRIYASDFVDKARDSKTRAVYNTAGTGSGKSSWFVESLIELMPEKKINRIWLLEPRKILRKEASMPNHQFQRLEKGKTLMRSSKAVVLTYGHFLSRLDQVDTENDLVLFDEFHELQGKMLRSLEECKAPKILMSATPVDIPMLSGSPTIHPTMKRRHPITVVKFPDDMSIVDAFMLAWNKHPEDIKRSLLIVPTHKQVQKTILALNYLKLGVPVSPLSARDRIVPREGIIVGTPYVQTGLDINPAVNIVIDCGKDIKYHKGNMVREMINGKLDFPWTDSNVNQQRIGRSGRLKAGIVYQPESAGTGEQAMVYPEPNDFTSKIVANHFGLPQLTALPYGVNATMPYLRLNTDKLKTKQSQKSVAFIHAMSMAGIRQQQWEDFYTKKIMNKNLGEDYEWLERVYNHPTWSHVPLMDWSTANYWLHLPHTTQYGINNEAKWSLPIRAVDGRWKPWEAVSNEDVHYQEISSKEIDSTNVRMAKALKNLKSAIMLSAKEYSNDEQYLNKMQALTA